MSVFGRFMATSSRTEAPIYNAYRFQTLLPTQKRGHPTWRRVCLNIQTLELANIREICAGFGWLEWEPGDRRRVGNSGGFVGLLARRGVR